MSYFTSTLQALAPLFALILIGYGLKRRRILHASHVPVMNGLVINVTLPALIIHGFASAPRIPLTDTLPAVSAFLSEIVVMALAYVIGRACRLPQRTVGMLMLISAFPNTGFLGYPMVLALFKDQMPSAIILDQFGEAMPLVVSALLIGPAMGGKQGSEEQTGTRFQRLQAQSFRVIKTLRTPLTYALAVGVAVRLIPWPAGLAAMPDVREIGSVLMQILQYLAQGTVPIVLLALGVSLRPSSLKGDARPVVIASTLKLMVVPLIAYLLARRFGLHGDIMHVAVLQCAMPTAVMASVYAAQSNLDGEKAVGIVFVTTVLSAVTVPFLLGILH